MSVQQTSLLAYVDITRSGALAEQTRQVYQALRNLGEGSNKMVSMRSGIPINCVTARMFELVRKGRVECVGKKVCRYSGRLVTYWRVA